MKNIMDDEETKIIKHHHNEMTWDFIQKVEEELSEFLPAMAGPCGLCSPCAKKEGKPCRFPEKKASCLSAYCIQVDAMAKACGMEYSCEGEVAFFSLLFFDGEKITDKNQKMVYNRHRIDYNRRKRNGQRKT